jgi:hypothetical protein
MIIVKKLVKRFGLKTVLRGLDFQVEKGEFVALLGPNGGWQDHFPAHPGFVVAPQPGAGLALPGMSCRPNPRRCAGVWEWSRTCPYSMAT